MRRLSVLLAVPILATACTTQSGQDGQPGPEREPVLTVVATVAPITNLVHNIGGDLLEITGLVPEGVNSHTFEPSPGDAAILQGADLVFANGMHLEVPSIQLAEQHIPPQARIVLLADQTITRDEWVFDFSFPEEDGDPNPHLWTHPLYAKRYAEIIAQTLAQANPENSDTYLANYEALAERFDRLDQAAREATETVPAEHRKLLTYHDSFPYFAREYGWEVIGAIEPSDFSEPRPRDVARLIDQIREEDIPAIFGSEVFASPVLETIARETGAAYVDDLRDDDLPGDTGDPEHSLLGLLVFDFVTIVEALGGDPSPFDAIDTSNLDPETTVEYRG